MNKDSIIKTINNEKLDTNELAELFWLLNKDQYKERPVTIEEFYSSKEFVAEKWPNIFPLWKKTLKEIFPTPFNAPYNEVLISAAAGSGKTVTATLSMLYDIYKLGCLKNPCEFYQLSPGTMIIMAIFSATAAAAGVFITAAKATLGRKEPCHSGKKSSNLFGTSCPAATARTVWA